MTFVVRIFFTGLIAFVPSDDGKELTVLVPQAAQTYTASDRSTIEPHQALILARAAQCAGDCRREDPEVAGILFPDKSSSTARESLSQALLQGTAWRLDGAELSIQAKGTESQAETPLRIHRDLRPSPNGQLRSVPESATEGKDFSWVADLGRIVPGAGVVDPRLLQTRPPAGRLAARLRLRSGEVWTYRLVKVRGEVLPLHFQTLGGTPATTGYSQALADLVMAEIRISAEQLDLVASQFGSDGRRTAQLTPENGIVEIALLNSPPSHFSQHAAAGDAQEVPDPGKHFELYYDLAKDKPPVRPVPVAISSSVAASPPALHSDDLGSKLLNGIRFGPSHGIYERIICPVAQLSTQGGDS